MRPKLRIVILSGAVAMGTLLSTGPREARAQFFVSTPGFSLGVGGYPAFGGLYPAYGVAPIAPAVVPVPVVRPYPYAYGRPWLYGPRPYYGGYYHGYRRW